MSEMWQQNIVKNGHNASGSQQYWYKDCGKRLGHSPFHHPLQHQKTITYHLSATMLSDPRIVLSCNFRGKIGYIFQLEQPHASSACPLFSRQTFWGRDQRSSLQAPTWAGQSL
jgi:hypothetical protein